MKRILLILVCLYCIASSYAVGPRLVQQFEFEIRGGLTMPLGGYHGGDNDVGLSLGLELRTTPRNCHGIAARSYSLMPPHEISTRKITPVMSGSRPTAYGHTV